MHTPTDEHGRIGSCLCFIEVHTAHLEDGDPGVNTRGGGQFHRGRHQETTTIKAGKQRNAFFDSSASTHACTAVNKRERWPSALPEMKDMNITGRNTRFLTVFSLSWWFLLFP